MLKGFEFNSRAILGSILYAQKTIDMLTGEVEFPSFTPINDLAFPDGATHFSVSGAYVGIDFLTGISDIGYTNKVNLPIDGATGAINLTTASIPPPIYTTRFFLLQIEFFQEVNGVQYTLKNGAYNALAIAEVM